MANFSLKGREICVALQLFATHAGRAASPWPAVGSPPQLGLASGWQPPQCTQVLHLAV